MGFKHFSEQKWDKKKSLGLKKAYQGSKELIKA